MPARWIRSPLVLDDRVRRPQAHVVAEGIAGLTWCATADPPRLPGPADQHRSRFAVEATSGVLSYDGDPVMCLTLVEAPDLSAFDADPLTETIREFRSAAKEDWEGVRVRGTPLRELVDNEVAAEKQRVVWTRKSG